MSVQESFVEVVKGLLYGEKLLEELERRVYCGRDAMLRDLQAIKTPPRRYYVRVNTLKISRDELIERLRAKNLEVYPDERIEEAIWFPVKGPNKLPDAKKFVVADKFAAESVYIGANLYAPGVVKADGVRKGDEVLVLAPTGEPVAYGIAEMDGEEMVRSSHGLAVRIIVSVYQAPKVRELEEYELGLFYDQSLASIVTTRVLAPMPGETIVDLCAAPGGKTSHIVQMICGKGRVIAFDRSERKARKMRRELKRLGIHNVDIIVQDSRKALDTLPRLKADKVLLDPPCTAMGVRPKLLDKKGYVAVVNQAKYQRYFIQVAAQLLKPGGVLVYSTCTLSYEENEGNIEYALRLGFELEEQEVFIGSYGACTFEYKELVQRFYPSRHDAPGYFIAKLRKVRG